MIRFGADRSSLFTHADFAPSNAKATLDHATTSQNRVKETTTLSACALARAKYIKYHS
jgi:hypothetical protein